MHDSGTLILHVMIITEIDGSLEPRDCAPDRKNPPTSEHSLRSACNDMDKTEFCASPFRAEDFHSISPGRTQSWDLTCSPRV